eukprot:TRINITY_DN2041_c0_g1_i1.p1 TRINITY_DN2041_c0_g1~~TRINITY_DN2041_c0_g1_i1.p1  ORF type:complete len:247 (-),score=61.99 TRINITY_DN2041_c0_g1_i1:74-778(-)
MAKIMLLLILALSVGIEIALAGPQTALKWESEVCFLDSTTGSELKICGHTWFSVPEKNSRADFFSSTGDYIYQLTRGDQGLIYLRANDGDCVSGIYTPEATDNPLFFLPNSSYVGQVNIGRLVCNTYVLQTDTAVYTAYLTAADNTPVEVWYNTSVGSYSSYSVWDFYNFQAQKSFDPSVFVVPSDCPTSVNKPRKFRNAFGQVFNLFKTSPKRRVEQYNTDRSTINIGSRRRR